MRGDLLTTLVVLCECAAIGVALFACLTFLGLGLTQLLLPARGMEVLLAPAVGLAVVELSFSWLTFVVPPYVAAVVAFVAFGSLTAAVTVRRRATILIRLGDIVGAGTAAFAFYLSLMQLVIQRGFITLGSFPSDNVFIYIQAAQYLRDHPMPSAIRPALVASPGSHYLATVGPAFPNSVGAIDAAASVLSGWPVHALFDPLSGLALAITVGPVWFFARAGLDSAWWGAAAAAAMLATNQLLYWVLGVGLQQESLGLPIFAAGLGAMVLAVRTESARNAALTGALLASLIAIYLPLAVLLIVCGIACIVVRVAVRPRVHWKRLIRSVGAAAGAAATAALAGTYVLLFGGGLGVWTSLVGARVPAGAISTFPPLPYVLGTLPFGHVWELSKQPLRHLENLLFPALVTASVLMLILMILGMVHAFMRRQAPEAAVLAGAILFAAYEWAIAGYPYAFVKAIGYAAPFTSVFVAYGSIGWEKFGNRRLHRRLAAVPAIALVAVLLGSANSTRDMLALWLQGDPAFPRPVLALSDFADVVPKGAYVLIDDPTTNYATRVELAAIAYFLPDRSVRVFAGPPDGTFGNQSVEPKSCGYDYVISSDAPDGIFTLIYTEPTTGLKVFKRTGAACRPTDY